MEQGFVFLCAEDGNKRNGVRPFGLHRRNRIFRYRIMPFSICLIAAQIGSQTIIGEVHVHTFVNETGCGAQSHERTFPQRAVRHAGSQYLCCVQ